MLSNKSNLIWALLLVLGVMACDPMEDTNEELDEEVSSFGVVEIQAKLVSDDFAALEGNFTVESDSLIADAGAFPSESKGYEYTPFILEDKFSHVAIGSKAAVSTPVANIILDDYTVTDDEYQSLGFTFGNFSSPTDLVTFMNFKYPNAVVGGAYNLNYKYFEGSVSDRSSIIVLTENGWEPYTFANVDLRDSPIYQEQFGQRFANFDDVYTAIGYLEVYLSQQYQYAEEEDQVAVLLDWYQSGLFGHERIIPFKFTDGQWDAYIEMTFAKKEEGWVADPAIAYEFGAADYSWVVTNFAEEYSGGTSNMETFGNFSCFEWTEDAIVEVIGARLEELFIDIAEGQKFEVKYSIYCGASSTPTIALIYSNGSWTKE